tara:strand:+ start:40581 stop:41045 length:465 start_codon:yes stop_codon:yes gene_type:complete
MVNVRAKFVQSVIVACMLLSLPSLAKRAEFQLILKNHLFYPAEIEIPANTKVKLIIHNQDQTPEEFDSFDLNREKVIFPHKKAVIFIGPLLPGRYEFFGEFNPNSAQGAIIVKPNKLSSNIKTRAASDVNILALNTAQKRVTHRVLVKELYRAD